MLLIMLILLEDKVHKLTKLRWEFELMTVASQRRQRETIS